MRHPDIESFSAALDELYGARIEAAVRKKGEAQCIGFIADFIDDAFVPGGERLLEKASQLLGETLLSPATKNGRFYSDYVSGEKTNLIDNIRAQINDKRVYAQQRLVELMCQDEAYGTGRLGSEADVNAIGGFKIFEHYNDVLARSRVELFYCGSAPRERVERAVVSALQALPRSGELDPADTSVVRKAGEPRNFAESMDVTQGKLIMGFRTGTTVCDNDYPDLCLFNTVFGGSVTSKLFMNVREKLSLCYYASSSVESHKGVMLVSSGIEFANFDRAREEILSQLEACRRGEIEEQELESARRTAVSALRSDMDSPARLEDFYLGQALQNLDYGPGDLAMLLEDVKVGQVAAAAEKAQLDSVYFLRGLE